MVHLTDAKIHECLLKPFERFNVMLNTSPNAWYSFHETFKLQMHDKFV